MHATSLLSLRLRLRLRSAGGGHRCSSGKPRGALRHRGLCACESSGPNHWGQRAGHPQAGARSEVLLHSSCPQLSAGTSSACSRFCHAHCFPGLMGRRQLSDEQGGHEGDNSMYLSIPSAGSWGSGSKDTQAHVTIL